VGGAAEQKVEEADVIGALENAGRTGGDGGGDVVIDRLRGTGDDFTGRAAASVLGVGGGGGGFHFHQAAGGNGVGSRGVVRAGGAAGRSFLAGEGVVALTVKGEGSQQADGSGDVTVLVGGGEDLAQEVGAL